MTDLLGRGAIELIPLRYLTREIITYGAICGWTFCGELLPHHREHVQQSHPIQRPGLCYRNCRYGGSGKQRLLQEARQGCTRFPKPACCSHGRPPDLKPRLGATRTNTVSSILNISSGFMDICWFTRLHRGHHST